MSTKSKSSKAKASLFDENTEFKPSKEFSKNAHVKSMAQYKRMHKESVEKPDLFWAREANELTWQKKWDNVLEWKAPDAKWFKGAKLNLCENCVDRHVEAGRGNKAAIIWEGEPGDKRVITYRQLLRDVSRFANALIAEGIKPKDKVLIYMPMTPEATIAMLACARIGAVHSVVFGGFSAESIKDRLEDSEAIAVITCDGGWRRGGTVALKENVDAALKGNKTVTTVIVQKRVGNKVTMKKGRDKWWDDVISDVPAVHKAKGFNSEHPLFILYTSGSTGKPKGILHTTGGYMVGTYTTCKYIFDMKEDDVYWCTADVGWITGHSYITYGPLLNGVTQIMYEGAPNYPEWNRFWSIIEEYGVSIFYTAPTAIRAFIKAGDEHVDHLLPVLSKYLPKSPAGFDEDQITDRSFRFLVSELVREQLFRRLGDELPYATAVEVTTFEMDGDKAQIGADIWVEKDSHKAMVIGKKGESLKQIGIGARRGCENLLEKKVFLELFVKVRSGWSDNARDLYSLGYDETL